MAADLKTISETIKNYANDVRHVMPVDKCVFGSCQGTATEQTILIYVFSYRVSWGNAE